MTTIPMKTVLQQSADELARISALAEEVDNTIGDWIVAGGAKESLPTTLFQGVDLLRQKVECMGKLVRNLADQEEGNTEICSERAADGVFLAEIRMACLAPGPHR